MTTRFSNQNSPRGMISDDSCEVCDINLRTILAAGVAQSATIPNVDAVGFGANTTQSNNFIAVITVEPGKIAYANRITTAVVPTGAFATTANEPMIGKTLRYVSAGDVISIITTATTCEVGIALFHIT